MRQRLELAQKACLAALLVGACSDASPRTPAPPDAGATLPPAAERPAPAEPDDAFDHYLRLDRGTVLRARPLAESDAVAVVDQPRPLAIREQRPPWFQVEATPAAGWVRLEGDQAARRLVRIRAGGRPRPSRDPDEAILALALRRMSSSREARCGPYRLLTDSTDTMLVAACDRLATGLDEAYRRQFGVVPLGVPRETILLFADPSDFRGFSAEIDAAPAGYAAFADAAGGFLALHAGNEAATTRATLVHELAHLIHRRALGDLPRWLSEGLADALSGPGTASDRAPDRPATGHDGQARRLLDALDRGGAPAVGTLVTQGDDAFDQGTVSYDYELSASFVRFLLDDASLAPRFRSFLASVAEGGSASADRLGSYLATEWESLDRALHKWLGSTMQADR